MTKEYAIFIRRLKNNNIYHLWRREVNRQHFHEMIMFLSECNDLDNVFLTRSIIWENTTQGYNFWLYWYEKFKSKE